MPVAGKTIHVNLIH